MAKQYDFNKAISKAVEPVGKRAFHAIIKTATNGLPKGTIDTEMWPTNLIARKIANAEAKAAAQVSLKIEDEARSALTKLFLDKEFRDALISDFKKGHALKIRNDRSIKRSSLFITEFNANPDKQTKEIIGNLIKNGTLVENDDEYLIVDNNSDKSKWERISKNTIPSKFSRIRKSATKI